MSEEKSSIKINIKTLDFKKYNLEINKKFKISEIKKKINEKYGILERNQRLIFQGKLLKNNSKIFECGIENDCTLLMVINDIFNNDVGISIPSPISSPTSSIREIEENSDLEENFSLLTNFDENISDETVINRENLNQLLQFIFENVDLQNVEIEVEESYEEDENGDGEDETVFQIEVFEEDEEDEEDEDEDEYDIQYFFTSDGYEDYGLRRREIGGVDEGGVNERRMSESEVENRETSLGNLGNSFDGENQTLLTLQNNEEEVEESVNIGNNRNRVSSVVGRDFSRNEKEDNETKIKLKMKKKRKGKEFRKKKGFIFLFIFLMISIVYLFFTNFLSSNCILLSVVINILSVSEVLWIKKLKK